MRPGPPALPALPRLTCVRCGHEWTRRLDTVPRTCPACHTPYWWIKAGVLPVGRPGRKDPTESKTGITTQNKDLRR